MIKENKCIFYYKYFLYIANLKKYKCTKSRSSISFNSLKEIMHRTEFRCNNDSEFKFHE